jgi:hypothetical protein
MAWSLWALAVPAAALSVLSVPAVREPIARALGGLGEATPGTGALVLSSALAVAAAAAAWWLTWRGVHAPAPVSSALCAWLGMEPAIRVAVVRPTMALARALAAFDDRVLARVPVGAAALVLDASRTLGGGEASTAGAMTRSARRSRVVMRAREGGIEALVAGSVAAVASGARRLGELARRPQTGLLHQYYAQAAVALTALAVVLALLR